MGLRYAFGIALLVFTPASWAQVRIEVPATRGHINVTYSEPADAGQAERLRELAGRRKAIADQLEALDRIDLVVVHSPGEMVERLGNPGSGALAGVSYLEGILFLSPVAWQRSPTQEALEHEMDEALVRYVAMRLSGGNRLPDWLAEGLVSVLTQQLFAPATAEPVERRASLLLPESESEDPAVGYWAVRYLVEARGGLVPLRQLLRLVAQRPDTFVENLQLVYGVPVGDLERDWRQWLKQLTEEERKKQGRGPRQGPLVKD